MAAMYGADPGGAREAQDWYAVLGLRPEASTEEITAAVERMSRQASALANTAPHRSQQLREIARAIKRDLLSGSEGRQAYDRTRAALDPPLPPPGGAQAASGIPDSRPGVPSGGPAPAAAAGLGARFMRFMQTGWTCPACGEGAMPNDRFCKACGAQLSRPAALGARAPQDVCAACGASLLPDENFCMHCGTRRR